MNGWIKLHRKIKLWEWYDHAPTRLIFIHLLLSVNHEKSTWKGITILPGQDIFSLNSLSKDTGFTVRQVRTAINNLLKTNDIKIETSRRFTLVTICNWSNYQGDEKSDKQTTRQTTDKRHTKRQTNDTLQINDSVVFDVLATHNRHAERQTNDTPNDKQTTTPKEIKNKEDKKEEFLLNLNLNASRLEKILTEDFISSFVAYWTKQTDQSETMLFEKLPYFDFEKQIALFESNRAKFLNQKPSKNGSTITNAKKTELYEQRKQQLLDSRG